MNAPSQAPQLSHNVTRISRLDLPGAGQVYVDGGYAYIGHIPNNQQLGTSILDVSDPKNPKVVSSDHARRSGIAQPQGARDRRHHDRQQRAQHDRDRPQGRRAAEAARAAARGARARADARGARREARRAGQPTSPRSKRRRRTRTATAASRSTTSPTARIRSSSISERTYGIGVHRFDMDANYAYISTEAEGYVGNILVIYDIRNPARSRKKSRSGGFPASTRGRREDDLAGPAASPASHDACRRPSVSPAAGMAACASSTCRDIRKPTTIGAYNYHPPFPGAVAHVHGAAEEDRRQGHRRRHRRGRPRAQRRGDGAAARPSACIAVDVRYHRSREDPAAARSSK